MLGAVVVDVRERPFEPFVLFFESRLCDDIAGQSMAVEPKHVTFHQCPHAIVVGMELPDDIAPSVLVFIDHTDEILAELGFSEIDVQRLRSSGAV
jgi:hypothetical protein